MSDERDGAATPQATAARPRTAADGGQTAVVSRRGRSVPPASGPGSERPMPPRTIDESRRDRGRASPRRHGQRRARRPRRPRSRQPKKSGGPSANPFVFVCNYLKQVVAELRKVIWPNRKQMVTYTTVVLVFLAFMVALIGLADLGLAKLVLLVFG